MFGFADLKESTQGMIEDYHFEVEERGLGPVDSHVVPKLPRCFMLLFVVVI